MKRGNGKIVTGDDFYNREDEMALFQEKLDEGANLLIIAQRRMGKSSFLMEFARRSKGGAVECLFIDLENCSSGPDAIAALAVATHQYQGLWGKTMATFSNIITKLEGVSVSELGIQFRAGLNDGNWRQKGAELLQVLASHEKPFVLMLDEIPILVNRLLGPSEDGSILPENRSKADEFMSWLRANSLRFQDRIRFVLCGSIGLAPVLNRAGLSATINNFIPFKLGPWAPVKAKGCLRELAKQYGVRFEEEALEKVVELLRSCIPHHVQSVFRVLYDGSKHSGIKKFTATMVEDAFRTELVSTHGLQDLVHYEERLRQALSPNDYTLAIDILSQASLGPPLHDTHLRRLAKRLDRMEALRTVVAVLEHDGYLVEAEDGWRFVSALVESWWKKRYKNTYTPLDEAEV